MPLDPKHRKRLQACIDLGDRSLEPVFVGRERRFDLVGRTVERVLNGATEGATLCFPGPPGVGKSAFLAELGKRCDARLRAGGSGSLFVNLPVTSLALDRQAGFAAEVFASGERVHPEANRSGWGMSTLKALAQSGLSLPVPLSDAQPDSALRAVQPAQEQHMHAVRPAAGERHGQNQWVIWCILVPQRLWGVRNERCC